MLFPEWLKDSDNAESGQRRNGLRIRGIESGRVENGCEIGFLTVWGRRARPRPLKIHCEGCFSRENGRGRRLEAVFRPKMGPRGVEEAKNEDFDRRLTQMGAGIAPRSEVRSPRSEVRGRKSEVRGTKTGKIVFILFSCCFLFSCLAGWFLPVGGPKILFA